MKTPLLSLAFAALLATGAHAADLTVKLVNASGNPVADAAVTVKYQAAQDMSAALEKRYEMRQQNMNFSPYVLVVPAGADVGFPNFDRVRHHVYSFSKGNRFELKLFGREDDRSVQLKKPGIAAIGCNIHDEMVGYIRVSDTPFFAASGPDGTLSLSDLPDGTATVSAWHPALGVKAEPVTVAATVGQDASITITLDIEADNAR